MISFGPPTLAHHRSGNLGLTEDGTPHLDLITVGNHEHPIQLDLVPDVGLQQLDVDGLANRNFVLLSTGLYDSVHSISLREPGLANDRFSFVSPALTNGNYSASQWLCQTTQNRTNWLGRPPDVY